MDLEWLCTDGKNQPIQPKTNQSIQNPTNILTKDKVGIEEQLLKLLKVNPEIKTKEISNALDLTSNQVKYYIKKLKDEEKIKRSASNRQGFWIIYE